MTRAEVPRDNPREKVPVNGLLPVGKGQVLELADHSSVVTALLFDDLDIRFLFTSVNTEEKYDSVDETTYQIRGLRTLEGPLPEPQPQVLGPGLGLDF